MVAVVALDSCPEPMSVVRDILGVSAQQGPASPLTAVMSSLGSAPAKPATGKKRKSFLNKFESKEVQNLRDSESLIKSPPTAATPQTPESMIPTSNRWKWRPFRNSARGADESALSHWDNRTDLNRDYSAAVRCNVHVDMVDIEKVDESVLSAICKQYGLSKEELVTLFGMLRTYELNFYVAADKCALSVEQIKDIYYTAFSAFYPNKKCKYSFANDVERKAILEEREMSIATEGREKFQDMKRIDKQLTADIKQLEQRIKSLDSDASFLTQLIDKSPESVASKTKKSAPSTPGRKSASTVVQASLASTDKKPPGYDLIHKYIPGTVAVNGGTLPASTTALAGKQAVDFSALTQLPIETTTFHSKRIAQFFQRLHDLTESEKALTAFIKKRDADIKALLSQK